MAKNHLTMGLGIALLAGVGIYLLFAYLWIQLAYNLWWEISTLNIFYAIFGLILIMVGIFVSYIKHHTLGEFIGIWGIALLEIVIFYYLLAL